MRRVIPLFVLLIGFATYVYFARIRPSREYDPTVRGSGTIEATEVLVAPKVAARIATLTVDEGDKVEAGQVLATLSCDDLQVRKAQADAQVVQAARSIVKGMMSPLKHAKTGQILRAAPSPLG